jgi:pyridoxamine 5'-phosphate oxidase family protein
VPQQVVLLSAKERDYLASQRLGRLATVGKDGSPHVVPVGLMFEADDGWIEIGGPNLGSSVKYRNVERDPRVAFVVDDTTPEDDSDEASGC